MKHALQTRSQAYNGANQHGRDRGVYYFILKHNRHTSHSHFALLGAVGWKAEGEDEERKAKDERKAEGEEEG